ncbi:hypothetical protein GCM10007853_04270 [Algimonas ampicilliniresistens]|jgi:hypothetical protein|uniref:Uncharacterized protein n=1 Tax=Algimonas ampicilliniresistens TaxID=1298735 RepID=A0ABQ5V6S7_9PROT|nr:hypothetical protein [Algimonas ampicilliniresistens]GLQ22553.1 hypothetical protein GCM10007853_04270 [Algimonas ampicilliniresistens]
MGEKNSNGARAIVHELSEGLGIPLEEAAAVLLYEMADDGILGQFTDKRTQSNTPMGVVRRKCL